MRAMQRVRKAEGEKEEEDSQQLEAVKEGVVLLGAFCEELPCVASKYLEETLSIFLIIIDGFPNMDIRERTMKEVPKILKNIMDKRDRSGVAKNCILCLMTSLDKDRQESCSLTKL